MNLKRQGLSLALVSIMSLGVTQAASAATILVFGQNGTAQTVTGHCRTAAQTATVICGNRHFRQHQRDCPERCGG